MYIHAIIHTVYTIANLYDKILKHEMNYGILIPDNAECLVSELSKESEISKKQTNHKRH